MSAVLLKEDHQLATVCNDIDDLDGRNELEIVYNKERECPIVVTILFSKGIECAQAKH